MAMETASLGFLPGWLSLLLYVAKERCHIKGGFFMPFSVLAPGYWRGAAREMKSIRSIAGSGVLSALASVIKSLSIDFGQLLRVSFTFLPVALSGFFYGPVVAGFTATVADIIGFILKPTGPYFFGFTFNQFLNGAIYGLWLYRQPVSLWRAFGACATSIVLVSFILNPLWLNILYGDAFWGLVWMRVPKNLVVLPVNTALLYGLLKVAGRGRRMLLKS
jgi:ECF transporter S component (folate family)